MAHLESVTNGKELKVSTKSSAEDVHLPNYVVLEGCIGVGKTTLASLWSEAVEARKILEVVEENPFLPEFYEDAKAHAFKTQMFFLLSRFKQQEQLAQPDLFQQRVVADYLFAKDRIFAELTLSGSELALYDQVFNALKTQVRNPELVVYLRAPIDVILERIQKRGRSFERNIDPGYLKDLIGAYDRFFTQMEECPVLIVDTEDLNFPNEQSHFETVFNAIQTTAHQPEGTRHVLTGPSRQPSLL